jgi:hypothetical protein
MIVGSAAPAGLPVFIVLNGKETLRFDGPRVNQSAKPDWEDHKDQNYVKSLSHHLPLIHLARNAKSREEQKETGAQCTLTASI